VVGEKKELDRRDRPSRRRSSPWLSTGTSLSLHLAEQSDCAKLRVRQVLPRRSVARPPLAVLLVHFPALVISLAGLLLLSCAFAEAFYSCRDTLRGLSRARSSWHSACSGCPASRPRTSGSVRGRLMPVPRLLPAPLLRLYRVATPLSNTRKVLASSLSLPAFPRAREPPPHARAGSRSPDALSATALSLVPDCSFDKAYIASSALRLSVSVTPAP